MVTQVIDLHRVHGSKHQHAHGEHHPVGDDAGEAERIVLGIVDLAQAGEEEHERAGERERVQTISGRDPRRQQPRRGEEELSRDVEGTQLQQVLPWHRWETLAVHGRHQGAVYKSAARLISRSPGPKGHDMRPHFVRPMIVFVPLIVLLPVGPIASTHAADGELRYGLHVPLAVRWLAPAETEALATPFMVLYAVHDAL